MRCSHCGKNILDNALRCPYCGKPQKEDYFGYQRAEQQARIRQQNPPKKDNSGKIILIIFGVLGGVFALVLMLVFLLTSGSGGSTAIMQYDGSFTIAPDCIFSVTDTGNTGMYTIYTRLDGGQVHIETVDAGDELHYLLEEGNHLMRVEKTTGESIVLRMTVSSGCIYNTATLEFDKRQIQTTNGGTGTTQPSVSASGDYEYPSSIAEYRDGELAFEQTLTFNDVGQLVYCCTDFSDFYTAEQFLLTFDDTGNVVRIDHSRNGTPDGTSLFTYRNQQLTAFDSANGSRVTFDYDEAGFLTEKTTKNADGEVTLHEAYSYDEDGRSRTVLIQDVMYQPENLIKIIRMDASGRCTSSELRTVSDGSLIESSVLQYYADADDKPLTWEYRNYYEVPYTGRQENEYNANGQLTRRSQVMDFGDSTDFPNQYTVTEYSYDEAGKLIGKTLHYRDDVDFENYHEIGYKYDEQGRLASKTDTVKQSNCNENAQQTVYEYQNYITLTWKQRRQLDIMVQSWSDFHDTRAPHRDDYYDWDAFYMGD